MILGKIDCITWSIPLKPWKKKSWSREGQKEEAILQIDNGVVLQKKQYQRKNWIKKETVLQNKQHRRIKEKKRCIRNKQRKKYTR